ncbi:G5 domain-containing protein [Anaerolineales bacterium HSG6]|nr:G5 domain-containing protein [Anaerolineales bacterium HSG6]MDM8529804.1 G5 domain-containing protein [Anaerolineales bacterium HSG25]
MELPKAISFCTPYASILNFYETISYSRTSVLFPLMLICLTAMLGACQTSPVVKQITVAVDGQTQALSTSAETVREVLLEASIELGDLDQVKPDLYHAVSSGSHIIVTRVNEEVLVEHEIIPFEQQTVVNEALAPGETRLMQLGVAGEESISYRLIYEDGAVTTKTEIDRQVSIEPIPEIMVVGPPSDLPPIPFAGTIAYLSNGNAWLMRGDSANRRLIATGSHFDEHVFALSPDEGYLLYTQPLSDDMDLPLNELWLASTTIVGEQPESLAIDNVLEAVWSPVVSSSLIAYSTAERTVSAPGWKANNDLWLINPLTRQPSPIQVLAPDNSGLYAWWGSNFAWSPDGSTIAYARPDEIGIITFTTRRPITYQVTPLVEVAPLETHSDWRWVPQISWSPDSRFLAAVLHGPPIGAEPAEESQQFEVWLLQAEGMTENRRLKVKVAEQVGMWANPTWGVKGIAYGEAVDPLQSVNSRYKLKLIDWDGSNLRQLFPFQVEPGVQLPQLAWSQNGEQLLFVYNGNLYLVNYQGSPPIPLTQDSQVSHLNWVAHQRVTTPINSSKQMTTTREPK